MKKTLLILSVGLSGLICAQNAPVQTSKATRAKLISLPSNSASAENHPATPGNAHKAVGSEKRPSKVSSASKVQISTSWNMFGILTAACTQVTVNQDLGLIAFTHRESDSLHFNSGPYETDYSTDLGANWDTSKAVIFKANLTGPAGTRYPNGVILNPTGNTTASSAFAITSGPHTNGTDWDSNAFGSIRLDSMYTSVHKALQYPNVTTVKFSTFSAPHYMSVTDDSIVHSVEEAWTYNTGLTAAYTFYGAVINTGAWNGATHSVTWTSTVLRPTFASYLGVGMPVDSQAEVQSVSMAWSQDGATGYVVFFGNLDSVNANFASLQPIVYKSIDHGLTWNLMPVTDYGKIPSLNRYLLPSLDSAGRFLPYWDITGDSGGYYAGHDVDMTVDMNNNLHIFGAIKSGAFANPDSGGYTYNPVYSKPKYIFDVYTTTANGGWKADLLDSLISPEGVDPTSTQWTSTLNGALTWGARIQASRTTDGTKVFCTWLDDYGQDGEILYPNITTIGIDVTTDMKTAPMRVTTDQNNFFLQVSDLAITNGSCWDVPSVVAADPAPVDGTTPVEFKYVKGNTLCNSDFTIPAAVNTVASAKTGFSISSNYPNPFNNITNFNINLANETVVSVVVYNLLGEAVYSIPAQKMSTGTHLITLNGANWNSGVYFYTVIADGQSITKKMVVQK